MAPVRVVRTVLAPVQSKCTCLSRMTGTLAIRAFKIDDATGIAPCSCLETDITRRAVCGAGSPLGSMSMAGTVNLPSLTALRQRQKMTSQIDTYGCDPDSGVHLNNRNRHRCMVVHTDGKGHL